MSRQLAFWVVFIVALIFTFGVRSGYIGGSYLMGGDVIFYVLVGLLGWQVYGPAIK